MIGEVRVALPCGCTLGESATWSAREAALYWIDIRAPAVHRLDPASGVHQSWRLPDLCGAVVPTASGVLLALGRDLMLFDPVSARITCIAEIEPDGSGNRLNEAKCDRQGRLWVGSMRDFAAAMTGSLYRLDPARRRPERVFSHITVPNSLGWSPDGRTMYFADTPEGALRAYDYDTQTGRPGSMRVLVAADSLPGRPDGCTVDAEGHVWTTRFGAGLVIRVSPEGKVTSRVLLPTSQPTACALGGPSLRTLFITTATQRLDPHELRSQPEAGHLFAVEVDCPGVSDTEFGFG